MVDFVNSRMHHYKFSTTRSIAIISQYIREYILSIIPHQEE